MKSWLDAPDEDELDGVYSTLQKLFSVGPEAIVASQVGGSSIERALPERRLWATVLLDGIVRAYRGDERDRAWMADQSDELGGYGWACAVLGLDPDAVKEALDGMAKTSATFKRSRRRRTGPEPRIGTSATPERIANAIADD